MRFMQRSRFLAVVVAVVSAGCWTGLPRSNGDNSEKKHTVTGTIEVMSFDDLDFTFCKIDTTKPLIVLRTKIGKEFVDVVCAFPKQHRRDMNWYYELALLPEPVTITVQGVGEIPAAVISLRECKLISIKPK